MNGALVIAAVVAVIEIGSPVADNLGLSVGLTSTAGQVAGSQVLPNATVPSWEQLTAPVAGVQPQGSVIALPVTAAALAADVTNETGPGVPTSTPATHPAVKGSPKAASTPGHTSTGPATIVSSPDGGARTAGADVSANAHGPAVGPGVPPGDGPQGRDGQQGPGEGGVAADPLPPSGAPGHDAGPGQGGPGEDGDRTPMPPPPGGAAGHSPAPH
jgi:hypothetical protein